MKRTPERLCQIARSVNDAVVGAHIGQLCRDMADLIEGRPIQAETRSPPHAATKKGEAYRAIPCTCGHSACKNWLVDPVAVLQGVSFSRFQAEAVAALLNGLANDINPSSPAPELNGTKPLVLYFGTDTDRAEFMEIVKETKPSWITRKL